MPEDEIEKVYALRAHLESYAARRVTDERSAEAANILQGLVDEMRACAASGDLARLANRDLQLHDKVLELSGYQALRRIVERDSLAPLGLTG
jgi:DNA-binding GntR family transcriptional regulator